MKLNALTQGDVEDLHQARMHGTGRLYHVRFMVQGEALQLGSCRTAGKNCNVMYQPVYWDMPQSFIDLVIERVQRRNPGVQVRAVKELSNSENANGPDSD